MNVPPEYEKPQSPGVYAGMENTAHIYHIVRATDDFESACNAVFALIRRAAVELPGARRVLYIDIEGHEGASSGYDGDFFEFQQEFLQGFLGPFLTAMDLPLISVFNPRDQREDLPDLIEVGPK